MKEKAIEQIIEVKQAGETAQAEDAVAPETASADTPLSQEEIDALLSRSEVLDALFANEAICNEVIARFLDELYEHKPAPVLRGRSALCPIPRPRTLQEAKKIVDDN